MNVMVVNIVTKKMLMNVMVALLTVMGVLMKMVKMIKSNIPCNKCDGNNQMAMVMTMVSLSITYVSP